MVDALTIPARQEHKGAPRAERPIRPAAASAPRVSLITELHRRWDAIWTRHENVDNHWLGITKDPATAKEADTVHLQLFAIGDEGNAVERLLMLSQPETDEDLAALAFHLHYIGAGDIAVLDKGGQEAYIRATESLFLGMAKRFGAVHMRNSHRFREAMEEAEKAVALRLQGEY